jgi:drug/metabolite transporter (DMT)-like permease
MALFAKEASARLPGSEVAFVRFAFGLVACAAVGARGGLRPRNKRGLALRGLLGGSAVLCYFLAIEHLPVGLATLLNYTAPVFTAIWAALFLGESPDGGTVLALALATSGVALVSGGSIGFGRWMLVGVLSAMLSGAAVATIREVRRTDGSWEIFAAFCVGGAVITGVPALRDWVAPDAHEWWLLAAMGATSIVAQLALTWSLRYVRAASAGTLQQLTPVGALVLGAVVKGDRITTLAALGAALTMLGVSYGAWHLARPGPVEDG